MRTTSGGEVALSQLPTTTGDAARAAIARFVYAPELISNASLGTPPPPAATTKSFSWPASSASANTLRESALIAKPDSERSSAAVSQAGSCDASPVPRRAQSKAPSSVLV